MTKLRRPNQDAKKVLVAPSSRDSIANWLDVLTSMLVMPESQRVQVRDELEDHLRSRVDDLLITGTAEPEAIRIAVAELGETAELAKLISHAHTRTNPRRRIMNFALITVALAGLSIGGYSLNNGSGNGGVVDPSDSSGVQLVDSGAAGNAAEKTHMFIAQRQSLLEVLNEIADAFGREVEISRLIANGGGMHERLSNREMSLEGEMTLEECLKKWSKRFPEEFNDYKMTVTDTVVRLQTNDEYQRSRIETRVISSPVWLERHELSEYAASIRNLLKVKHDLSRTSIEVIGEVIVVASPPEIHKEILKLVHELDVVIKQRNEERRMKQEAEKQARDERRGKAYEQLMVQHADITERLTKTKEKLQINDNSINILLSQIEQEKVSPHPDSPGIEQYRAFLSSRRGFSEIFRNQIAEDEARALYLKNKMLETEYQYLFDELD